MDTPKLTTPTPWQERVLAVPEHLNLAMLGGRGSGKTTALALLVLRQRCSAPRSPAGSTPTAPTSSFAARTARL